jgi:hypothetical protein
MSRLNTPLSAHALDEYVREVIETILPGDPADSAALLVALEAFDVTDAAKKPRLTQVADAILQVAGRNLTNGQVLTLAVTVAGTGYEVGDAVVVTTATGEGAGGYVSSVDGGGGITGVVLAAGGSGYLPADTACTITTDGGVGGTVVATVATNQVAIVQGLGAEINP